MKPETKLDLKRRAATGTNPDARAAQDALASDARQAKTIRELKKRLKLAHSSWFGPDDNTEDWDAKLARACDLTKPLKETKR